MAGKRKKVNRVLLAALDPVHDLGLRLIKKALEDRGHYTKWLPPDVPIEEVVKAAIDSNVDTVLIGRTVGYGIAEVLGRFVDLAEAAGLREQARLAIGGMAIRPALAAELGFDAGFGPETEVEEAVAYVEGRPYVSTIEKVVKEKIDITCGHDYEYQHSKIAELLGKIADLVLTWTDGKTSPGIKRAQCRQEMLEIKDMLARDQISEGKAMNALQALRIEYAQYSDPCISGYYLEGKLPPKCRLVTEEERTSVDRIIEDIADKLTPPKIQHVCGHPLVFIQYGTGCPIMDLTHIKVAEGWGVDGLSHIDPSWGARAEGLVEGLVSQEENGTIITLDGLGLIKDALEQSTMLEVRAHRGLNTPETVVLAGQIHADYTRINMIYGSLGAGTDPARLVVDAVRALKLASEYGLAFAIPGNEELSGVPAYKALASILIMSHLGLRMGAKPILQPLFCYSPDIISKGWMEDNYVDFNAAKIYALREILNAPVWAGAPIGFFTHTEDRVQSAVTTALHAGLAASLCIDAMTIASSDEAYAGGPITAASRTDTLRAVQESLRFFGHAGIEPTQKAQKWAAELVDNIEQALQEVVNMGNFVKCLYDGVLGSLEEGAHPGLAGIGTVVEE